MKDHSFTKEFGLTHAEFFRSLPSAIENHPYRVEGRCVTMDYDDRSVEIELGAQQVRKIALLEIPFTNLSFTFKGFELQDIDAFMQRFNLYFRRGGG
ncbi:MAG: hypothetical protein OER96_02925 [Gammaproteobacteria bacterium]|nr:hypothetical protein [Gammaproteobacteria bacterium]